jgi:hypothetical protein
MEARLRAAGSGLLEAMAAKLEGEAAWLIDPRPWIEKNLWIRTKERQVIRFDLNWAQRDYCEYRTPWDIILKPRQLGFTTLISGLFFADTILRPNTTSVLVAHDFDSSELIFRIVRLFWERLPAREKAEVGRPKYDRKGELYWPKIGSTYYVGTAGSTRFGHGLTINNLHCSEVSRWTHPEDSLTGLLEAVPAGGRVVLESTANGMGNYFHQLWTTAKGSGKFAAHCYFWWEDPSYRIAGARLTDLTPEEAALKQRQSLHDDQIRWRRQKQADLRDRFQEQYPEDDVTCFLASGRCCFDTTALRAQQTKVASGRAEVVATLTVGKREPISMVPAQLLVWRRPQQGERYVIGADVGEGLEGRDGSCAFVMERKSCQQVAELHGWVSPERFGHLLDALGRWYNGALVGVERNNHGHSTLNTLRHTCHYPWLYQHVRYDAHSRTAQPMLGWPTDAQTKPILVDELAAAISNGHILLNSTALIDECFSFVTKDNGAQEAQEGAHDDRVMAAGIAWQVRKRGQYEARAQKPPGW